jgi:hypothetical protein
MNGTDNDTPAMRAGAAFAAALRTLSVAERERVVELLAASPSELAQALARDWWDRRGDLFANDLAVAVDKGATDISDLGDAFPFGDVLRAGIALVVAEGVRPTDRLRYFRIMKLYVERGAFPEYRAEVEAAAGCRLAGRELENDRPTRLPAFVASHPVSVATSHLLTDTDPLP